jgi:hypothetical protein
VVLTLLAAHHIFHISRMKVKRHMCNWKGNIKIGAKDTSGGDME